MSFLGPALHLRFIKSWGSLELIIKINEGRGMKSLSEEELEASHKYVRRYRELLSRKNSYIDNIRDVFVRLLCQSNYLEFLLRKSLVKKTTRKSTVVSTNLFDNLFKTLIIEYTTTLDMCCNILFGTLTITTMSTSTHEHNSSNLPFIYFIAKYFMTSYFEKWKPHQCFDLTKRFVYADLLYINNTY